MFASPPQIQIKLNWILTRQVIQLGKSKHLKKQNEKPSAQVCLIHGCYF